MASTAAHISIRDSLRPTHTGVMDEQSVHKGWASYKVGETVRKHGAWRLGGYSVFRKADLIPTRSIEAPFLSDVRFHHMITVALDSLGEIQHVINETGEATTTGPKRFTPKLAEFPGDATMNAPPPCPR